MKKRFCSLCALALALFCMLSSGNALLAEPSAISADVAKNNISDGFSEMLQNEKYALYYNSSTDEIAIYDRVNGITQYSNPPARESDPIADMEKKNELNSQVIIHYYDDQILKQIDSYHYGTALRRNTYKKDGKTLKVQYNLGEQNFTVDQLPQVISKERMEKKILAHLTEDERKSVLKRYKLYSKKELDKDAFDAVKNSFPIIAEHDIYIREQLPDYIGEEIWKLFEKTGYTIDDLQHDCDENRIENTYHKQAFFGLELEYTLNEDGFSVSCDPEKITYADDFKPVRIVLLPYFGAGGISDDGYMFVPDGSGAVINFNNGKLKSEEYWRSCFGDDSAVSKDETTADRQEILLPVFALSTQNRGFLASIDSGFQNAGIAANVSGKSNSYNNVFPFFTVYESDLIIIGEDTANNSFLSTAKRGFSEKIVVSYHTVGSYTDCATFAGMYRNLLIKEGKLPKNGEAGNSGLNLELIGTVAVKKHFLGFPYSTYSAVTTYEQAAEIVKAIGTENTDIRYINALKGGINQKSASSLTAERAVGNKKSLARLQASVHKVYFSYYAAQQKSASKSVTARSIGGQPIKRYGYDMVSRQKNKSEYMVQLSVKTLNKNGDRILKSAAKNGIDAVDVSDIGWELNSDFNEKKIIDTAQAEREITSYLKKLSGKLSVSVQKGAVYTFPYVDKIWNIPTDSSGYNIFDETVPFYGMVVRGSIPIVTEPVNTAADARKQFLKTVEIGAQLQYSWLYSAADNVINYGERYYNRNYKDTAEQARQYAAEAADLQKKIGNAFIVGYSKNENGLVKVDYDCNVSVLLNYSENDVEYGTSTVPAYDFITIE